MSGAHPRAALDVATPSGQRSRVPLLELPFTMGRQAGNSLVLRDSRASRTHARILHEGDNLILEDLNSRHGTFVNGARIERHPLRPGDRIEFGVPDSYRLTYSLEEADLHRLLDRVVPLASTATPATGSLTRLRALLEVARTLQSALSADEVLASVVDAALAITGAERGFLLLRRESDLDVRVARDHRGLALSRDDLRIPTSLIHRALTSRRELLSMTFDPQAEQGLQPEMSIAALELRSVVCVPLIRIRAGQVMEETSHLSAMNETLGLLYLDSRAGAADLSTGNRELLQTLALEASTILENARLLDEERARQRLEEELDIAREIQVSLLPRSLPSSGWFRAAGSSVPSHQVGGDYFDVRLTDDQQWSVIVADVAGKGVSSALLASLLQGAFLFAAGMSLTLPEIMRRINVFLLERTLGEKYVTLFAATLDRQGRLRWVNAGHPKPVLLRRDNTRESLGTTGMPVGMLERATYDVEERQLRPGDKVVAFTDGLSEARDAQGREFDRTAMPGVLADGAALSCGELHAALVEAASEFTEGVDTGDDVTVVVFEYQGE